MEKIFNFFSAPSCRGSLGCPDPTRWRVGSCVTTGWRNPYMTICRTETVCPSTVTNRTIKEVLGKRDTPQTKSTNGTVHHMVLRIVYLCSSSNAPLHSIHVFLLSVDFGASIWPTTAWRHSTFLGCIRRFAAALVETPIIVGSNPNLILSSITLFCWSILTVLCLVSGWLGRVLVVSPQFLLANHPLLLFCRQRNPFRNPFPVSHVCATD